MLVGGFNHRSGRADIIFQENRNWGSCGPWVVGKRGGGVSEGDTISQEEEEKKRKTKKKKTKQKLGRLEIGQPCQRPTVTASYRNTRACS